MSAQPQTAASGPVAPDQRIPVLDVARGVALLGILLINVQAFNLSALAPEGRHGLTPFDGGLQWFLESFVANKFWTMFSLLFGMGFAVMLIRAGAQGHGFVARYLRRSLALAAFGALHIVLIWSGDILLNYAIGAWLLLAILFCGRWLGLALGAALLAADQALGLPSAETIVLIAFCAATALYLRSEDGRYRKWLAATVLVAALWLGLISAYASDTPGEAQKTAAYAILLMVSGAMALCDRSSGEQRLWRAGVLLYMAPLLGILIGAAVTQWTPASVWPQSTPAQEAQTKQIRAQRRARAEAENKLMSSGSYPEAVRYRAQNGFERPTRAIFNANIGTVGLFLFGMWLIRSGAATRPEEHLALWRKFAWAGFPIGTAFVLGGGWLLESFESVPRPVEMLLSALVEAGNFLMMLGYLSFLILLMRRPTWNRRLSRIAPMGRMALTNYLLQSVVATLFFYGYGLGLWGLGRTWQAVFAFAVFGLLLSWSRWWLSGHRYGPMEWLWRWITYARRPSMRLSA